MTERVDHRIVRALNLIRRTRLLLAGAVACLLIAVVAGALQGQQGLRFPLSLSVPTDPRASYQILAVAGTKTRPIITTRRSGPSGVSFAKREVDCRRWTFRYLAEGDTMEELRASEESRASRQTDRHGPLTEGSISSYVANAACRLR